MATNNSSQAINASVDDISTESLLNEGLDLPISTEAGSTAPFSWEVLQDGSANFSVMIAYMADVIQQTVGQFASDQGFDSKMALAFGAGNDYSGLKSVWQAGTFDAFPQIEIRTGAELAGANAAYAGATNTIYVSQDFLRQNANNSQAIASVLVEEFGHSVDSSVNEIDSPGDEGELFSALVQGIDLTESQIQKMKQENDSVSLSLRDGSADMSYFSNTASNDLSSRQTYTQAENSATYSNDYHWDASSVFKQIINERGKSTVVFVNGILVDDSGFDDGEGGGQKNDVDKKFNLTKLGHENEISGIDYYETSIEFKPYHNPSYLEIDDQSWNGSYDQYNAIFETFEDFSSHFSRIVLRPALEKFVVIPLDSEEYQQYNNDFLVAFSIYDNATNLKEITPSKISSVSRFLEKYGDLSTLEKRLNEEFLGKVPNDLLESFAQFWSESPSTASDSVNNLWVDDTKKFLETQNNSLIVIAHSQGNFFIEDALNSFSNLSRVKVISLGSPTNYSASGLDKSSVILRPELGSEQSQGDPVTYLRYDAGSKTPTQKIAFFLNGLSEIINNVVPGVALGHSLGDLGPYKGYLSKSVKGNDFQTFFASLHSSGYYFPNAPIQVGGLISGKGTESGDWIEGSSWDDNFLTFGNLNGREGNDVIRGREGNDYIIGGQGWDFIDGGQGKQDEASYEDNPNGIRVEYTLKYAGSDAYEAQDGFGQTDVLVDIEKVSGSNHNDFFKGGYGTDIFYGRKGNDYIEGNSGQDKLFGEGDDDEVYGGIGDDTLEGGGGKDKLYGGDDNDEIYGNVKGWKWDWQNDTKDQNGPNQGSPAEASFSVAGISLLAEANFSSLTSAEQSSNSLSRMAEANFDADSDDIIYGGNGNDLIDGDLGDDSIYGDAGDDIIYGGFGSDVIYGGTGDDKLNGAEDNDVINGGDGADYLFGKQGADELKGDSGSDKLFGGTGNDILSGGGEDDEIWGEDGDDIINGDAGNDLIYGGEDNDIISGGLDNDRIYGEGGSDRISGDEGNDMLFGQDGNDIIDGGIGDDTLEAGNGIDTLNGGDGIDRLYGQNDNDTLNGDAGDDFLDGGDGADKLSGGAGNDELLGQAGNDVMYGNAGDDAIAGGAGKDYLEGNEGNDILNGGADSDMLYGNEGDDILNGDDGRDTLFGGAGNDRINGGGDVDMVNYLTSPSGVVVNLDEGEYYGNDRQSNANDAISPDNPAAYYTDLEVDFAINPGSAADGFGNIDTLIDLENITGSQFADVLIGNDRNNTIFGLGGDDLLVGGGGDDQFHGGNGIDTVSYRRSSGGVTVNLEYNQANGADGYDRIFDTENIVGSNFNDTLTGDAKANLITAGDGDDSVFGGAGNDTLYGEFGDDQVSGGIGNDTLYGNLGDDLLNGDVGDDLGYGGAGDDRLNGGEGSDRLWGDQGNDALNGGTGDDFLDGGIGNDTLYGNDGNDQLFGQAGDDWLDGGTGIDILSGGEGDDQLLGQAGDDTLDGGLGDDQLWGGDDNDTLNGQAGDDWLDGGTGSDILSGGDGNDQLFGQAGDDSLDGGLGDDWLDGGLGTDALSGGDGNDQLFGQAGDDSLDGGLGNDWLDGGVGNDGLSGGEGNDQLFGQAGNDTLNGGLGDDQLWGGEGSDILAGGGGRDLFYINRGDDSDTISDFTGVGRGTNPAPYLVPEIDTIVFSGADLIAKNMLLSQTGSNLVISFEDIDNTSVTLQNFALENLDNHHIDTGASLTVGNILFEWDTDIQDSFDVINAEVNPTQVLRPNFVTFLNDLANKTSGFDHSDDVINGQGGNDTLRGLGGNDILRGGEGNDVLIGGAGQDYLAGQSGNDYLEGGLDDDYLRGGDGNDFLSGGFGNDLIEGGLGNDQMFGAGGRDRFVIYRGDGADAIADFDGVGPGHAPYEDIISEADILQFIGSGLIAQNMILTQTDYEPATGSSLVITFEGITDTSITLNNFSLENLDNLSTLGSNGSPLGNVLFQFDGDDIIKDSFDIFNSDWVFDQVLNANSVTFLNDLDNEISGFDWSDDIINGQGGNDILLGLGGNDILRGGLGNDVLLGGTGTNTLTGNVGFDTFVLSLGGSSLINDFTLGEDFIGLSDGMTFEQLKIEQGTGVNAGSTSIKLLGDESILMSLKGIQANALNTAVFLPASSIFQSSSV